MTTFTDIGQGWLVEPADDGRYLALAALALFVIAGGRALRRAAMPRPWRTTLAIVLFGMATAWLVDGLLTGDFLVRGFSSLGAVTGGALSVLVLAHTRGAPGLRAVADALAPPGLVSLALARGACLLEGCDFGAPGAGIFSVAYPRGTAAFTALRDEGRLSAYASATPPLVAFPLVEAVPALLGGLALWALRRRLPPGVTAACALAVWGAARGAAELSRHGDHTALATVAFGTGLLGAVLAVAWARHDDRDAALPARAPNPPPSELIA